MSIQEGIDSSRQNNCPNRTHINSNKPTDFFAFSKDDGINISFEYEDHQIVPIQNFSYYNPGKTSIQKSNVYPQNKNLEQLSPMFCTNIEINNSDRQRNANQCYSFDVANQSVHFIQNPYVNYYPNTDNYSKEYIYSKMIPVNNASSQKMYFNQCYGKLPPNQFNQYISFQNHFNCFPSIQYTPYYPSSKRSTLTNTNPNINPSYKTQQEYNCEVINAIESLFSFSYLNKDIYFRSIMDENGWIPLSVLMSIISIKKFNISTEQIVQCLTKAVDKTVEIKSEENKGYFIRKENWAEFSKGLLNIEDIKNQKLNKTQNHYLSSRLTNTDNENRKEFTCQNMSNKENLHKFNQ